MAETTRGIVSLQDYLDQLKAELAGSDPALVQDALYDAEGYLREEIGAAEAPGPAGGTAAGDAALRSDNGSPGGAGTAGGQAALQRAIQRFGSPREVAEAYRETDARVTAALAQPPVRQPSGLAQRIFGIFLDPKAYGSLLFMVLSLVTGILYFVWAVTGLALSLGFSILVIGLPFTLLFLASIRLFALLEGRLIESLLGLRMPRRPQFPRQEGTFLSRLGKRLSDPRTWSTLLYMVLKLPLGILSFTIAITMLAISLALLAAPIAQMVFDQPLVVIGGIGYDFGLWSLPLLWVAGLLDLLATMHVARGLGRLYGWIAKAMLVST